MMQPLILDRDSRLSLLKVSSNLSAALDEMIDAILRLSSAGLSGSLRMTVDMGVMAAEIAARTSQPIS